MPSRKEIITFEDAPPPAGQSAWVPGAPWRSNCECVNPGGTATGSCGRLTRSHLHVFGFDSPELVKHRIFRDWLRGNPAERELYSRSKRESAAATNASGEHSMQYNARKERVVREIYERAFVASGLLPHMPTPSA